jgi:hypothetical protein
LAYGFRPGRGAHDALDALVVGITSKKVNVILDADIRSFSKTRRGKFLIERKSWQDHMETKLKEVKDELRRRMHQLIPLQGKWLAQVVSGYFNYHAVPTNTRALSASAITRQPVAAYARATQRQDATTFERMKRLVDEWLPAPRILHPWPATLFAVKHSRWEPYAHIGHVRLCAGGAQQ